ncbi:MAG TPA: hypothetical protein P5525_13270, partial [Candidatus Paceibacterota bacterium]|nr:hypothetical protein [Candidatus Paceibacterota bacterium]
MAKLVQRSYRYQCDRPPHRLRRLAKEKIELSRTIPACMLLEGNMREDALDQVQQLEEQAHSTLQIRGTKIGGSSRMKVL